MLTRNYLLDLRSASLDVEPLYTFRSHTGPVLCLTMSGTGEQCYSGGLDGLIQCWNLPSPNIDPYDSFGEKIFLNAQQNLLAKFYFFIFLKMPRIDLQADVKLFFRPECVDW